MTILILFNSLQITVEDNRILTKIVRMLDSTPLCWHLFSDTQVYVAGKRELLYELLSELASMYLGKIEII